MRSTNVTCVYVCMCVCVYTQIHTLPIKRKLCRNLFSLSLSLSCKVKDVVAVLCCGVSISDINSSLKASALISTSSLVFNLSVSCSSSRPLKNQDDRRTIPTDSQIMYWQKILYILLLLLTIRNISLTEIHFSSYLLVLEI